MSGNTDVQNLLLEEYKVKMEMRSELIQLQESRLKVYLTIIAALLASGVIPLIIGIEQEQSPTNNPFSNTDIPYLLSVWGFISIIAIVIIGFISFVRIIERNFEVTVLTRQINKIRTDLFVDHPIYADYIVAKNSKRYMSFESVAYMPALMGYFSGLHLMVGSINTLILSIAISAFYRFEVGMPTDNIYIVVGFVALISLTVHLVLHRILWLVVDWEFGDDPEDIKRYYTGREDPIRPNILSLIKLKYFSAMNKPMPDKPSTTDTE